MTKIQPRFTSSGGGFLFCLSEDLEFRVYTKRMQINHKKYLTLPRDTRGCVKKIRDYLTIIDFQKVNKARNEAKNYFMINSFYFSENAEALVSELLSLLVNQYVIDYQNRVEHIRDEVGLAERKTIREKKPEVLGKLKAAMKGEISAGYYDAESEDTQS